MKGISPVINYNAPYESAGIASLRAYDVVSRLKRQTISSSMAAGNLKQVSASTFGIPIARTAGFRPFATFRISRRPLQFDQTPTRRPRQKLPPSSTAQRSISFRSSVAKPGLPSAPMGLDDLIGATYAG